MGRLSLFGIIKFVYCHRGVEAAAVRGDTGIYDDEGGAPMLGSELVRDPAFQDRVVAETRAFLARAS